MKDKKKNKDRDRLGRFQKGNKISVGNKGRLNRSRVNEFNNSIPVEKQKKIIKKLIKMAEDGDISAINVIAKRLWPKRKGGFVKLTVPKRFKTIEDVNDYLSYCMQQVAEGNISPEEAKDIAALLNTQLKAFGIIELEEEVAELKELIENSGIITPDTSYDDTFLD